MAITAVPLGQEARTVSNQRTLLLLEVSSPVRNTTSLIDNH